MLVDLLNLIPTVRPDPRVRDRDFLFRAYLTAGRPLPPEVVVYEQDGPQYMELERDPEDNRYRDANIETQCTVFGFREDLWLPKKPDIRTATAIECWFIDRVVGQTMDDLGTPIWASEVLTITRYHLYDRHEAMLALGHNASGHPNKVLCLDLGLDPKPATSTFHDVLRKRARPCSST